MKYFTTLVCFAFLFLRLQAIGPIKNKVLLDAQKNRTSNSVCFTENKGQVHDGFYHKRSDVLFMGNTPQEQLIIKSNGVSHQLKRAFSPGKPKQSKYEQALDTSLKTSTDYFRVDMQWLGANTNSTIEKFKPSKDYVNYYNVKYAENGILGVRNYESIRLKNIYNGIDVYYYPNGNQIEYDFEIAHGADYKQIKIQILGADAFVNESGNLEMKTPLGVISESAPRVFQNGKELKSSWRQIDAQTWGFEIEQYNPNFAMRIDPLTRVWGTYYGGSTGQGTYIYSVVSDSLNNVFICGETSSSSNIATLGSHQTVLSGSMDGLIAKLNSSGVRVWGSYYGGSTSIDRCNEIVLDSNLNIYAVGVTTSSSNIASPGSFLSSFSGNYMGYLVKFDAAGTRVFGTYFGGNNTTNIKSISFDFNNDLILVGNTSSSVGISSSGAYQNVFRGVSDGFIVKFSKNGTFIWGTYFGGTLGDEIKDVDVNTQNEILISGLTESSSFISTSGAAQQSIGGSKDAFVAKFGSSGSLIWSTYIGGSGYDYSTSLVVEPINNNIYISGLTESNNNIYSNGFKSTLSGTNDVFLVKLNSNGIKKWGTYFGGNGYEDESSIAIDFNSEVFITSHTNSISNISYNNPYQASNAGADDGFVAKFDSIGQLKYATYYGGSGSEKVFNIFASKRGSIFICGLSNSDSNIATAGVHQNSFSKVNGGGFDGFVVKFNDCPVSSSIVQLNTCKSYTWHGNTYTSSGDYTYTTSNYLGCDSIVTLKLSILNKVTSLVKIVACDSFVWKGNTYRNSGSFYDTLVSYQTCDSIVESQLVINKSSFNILSVAVCDQFVWHQDTLKNSGVYFDTIVNYFGCDSICKLNLTIYPSAKTTIQNEACKTYIWYGNTYSSSGIYSKKLQGFHGCDSVVFLNLIINKYTRDTILANTCTKQYNWRGKVLLQTGVYSDTTLVSGNCDSIHVLQINVTPIGFLVQVKDQYKTIGKTAFYYVQSALPGVNYQWQSNIGLGWVNLSNAGQYSGVNKDTLYVSNVLLSNDNYKFRCIVKIGNCTDTSIVVSLYVCPLITEQPFKKYTGAGGSTFFTVKCDISNASFQWQADNGSGYQNLSNAGLYRGVNTNTLIVSNVALSDNNTLFRCLVSYMNCRDTSDSASLIVLEKFNINLCNNNSFVNVFPNPTHNFVNVLLPSDKVGSPYKITNDLGQVIKTGHISSEESTVDFKEFPSGVYILTIGDELLDCFKIVKIWDK